MSQQRRNRNRRTRGTSQNQPSGPGRNPFTDQKNTAANKGLPHRETITGHVRVAEVVQDPGVDFAHLIVYSDYAGFQRSGLASITSIMSNYERWKLKRLIVRYVPTVSKMESGTMAMAPDFDILDPPYTESSHMAISTRFRSGPVSNSLEIDATPPTSDDMMFVAPAAEPRLSSTGFTVARAEGLEIQGASRVVGFIEYQYSIELFIRTPPAPNDPSQQGTDLTVTLANGTFNAFHVDCSTWPTHTLSLQTSTSLPTFGKLSGIYDSPSSGVSLEGAKRDIEPGTRLWFSAPSFTQGTPGTAWTIGNTLDIIGHLFLDSAFTRPVFVNGTASGTFDLLDTRAVFA